MSKILGPLVLALCLALGFGRSASAQIPAGAIAFSPSAATSITIDEGLLKFTIAQGGWTCNEGYNLTTSAAIPCSGQLYLVPTGTGINQSVQIDAFSGGTEIPIETVNCASVACTNRSIGGSYDLSISTLTVTGLNGTKIDGASAAVSGSATPASFDGDVGGTETVGGGCPAGLASYVGSPSSCSFAPTGSLSLVKDMGLDGLTGLGANTPTLTLNSITEGFALVPEPASMACLLAGLVGLAAARGKRRRA
jgi:hypothetical protein